MALYNGFSTQSINAKRTINVPTGLTDYVGTITNPVVTSKKYRVIDDELVILNYLNALNIPQGSKPGKPSYGTNLWNFIFEPNTQDTVSDLQEELLRVSSMDPRLIINSINIYAQDNSIVAQIELAVNPNNVSQILNIMFDQQTSTASLV